QEFITFYQKLLGTSDHPPDGPWGIISQGRRVLDDDYDALCSPVTDLEIKNALWSIGENKAPGPDGDLFDSLFYLDSAFELVAVGGILSKVLHLYPFPGEMANRSSTAVVYRIYVTAGSVRALASEQKPLLNKSPVLEVSKETWLAADKVVEPGLGLC
ncbi:hypothetical protein Dimus_036988, partial [Dionaea muscipula]